MPIDRVTAANDATIGTLAPRLNIIVEDDGADARPLLAAIYDAATERWPAVLMADDTRCHDPSGWAGRSSVVERGMMRSSAWSRNACNIADYWRVDGPPSPALVGRLSATLAAISASDKASIAIRNDGIVLPDGYGVSVAKAPLSVRRFTEAAFLLALMAVEHEAMHAADDTIPAEELTLCVHLPSLGLHPRWERTILANLRAAADVAFNGAVRTQMVVATSSPLVLASAEPAFDADRDALWRLPFGPRATAQRLPWERRGTIDAWLTSDLFGLREPRSLEAELAIVDAQACVRDGDREPGRLAAITTALEAALPAGDPLLSRWRWYTSREA